MQCGPGTLHAPLRARVTIACASCSAASSRWMPSWPAGTSMPPCRCCLCLRYLGERPAWRRERKVEERAAWSSPTLANPTAGPADHAPGRSRCRKPSGRSVQRGCGALAERAERGGRSRHDPIDWRATQCNAPLDRGPGLRWAASRRQHGRCSGSGRRYLEHLYRQISVNTQRKQIELRRLAARVAAGRRGRDCGLPPLGRHERSHLTLPGQQQWGSLGGLLHTIKPIPISPSSTSLPLDAARRIMGCRSHGTWALPCLGCVPSSSSCCKQDSTTNFTEPLPRSMLHTEVAGGTLALIWLLAWTAVAAAPLVACPAHGLPRCCRHSRCTRRIYIPLHVKNAQLCSETACSGRGRGRERAARCSSISVGGDSSGMAAGRYEPWHSPLTPVLSELCETA